MNQLLTLLYLLLIFPNTFAQMAYRQYDASTGFPTNQFYEVFEDSRGYIWALSDGGIYRFNGDKFEKIETDPLLGTSIPIDIIEDKRGIFILFIDGIIGCYNYRDRVIVPHSMNSELEKIVNAHERENRPQNSINNSLRSIGDTALIFSLYGQGGVVIGKNNISLKWTDQKARLGVRTYAGKSQICVLDKTVLRKTVSADLFDFKGCLSDVFDELGVKLKSGANTIAIDLDSVTFIFADTDLFKFVNNKPIFHQAFENKINAVDTTKNGVFLIHLNGGKTKVFDPETNEKCDWKIPFRSVTRTIADRSGGRWISTLYDGVIYFPNEDMKLVEGTKGKCINALLDDKQEIYAGTPFGEIIQLSLTEPRKRNKKIAGVSEVSDFVVFEGELLSLSTSGIINVNSEKPLLDSPLFYQKINDCLIKEDTLFIASLYGVFKYKGGVFWINDSARLDHMDVFKSEYISQISAMCLHKERIIGSDKNELFLYNMNQNRRGETVLKTLSRIRSVRSDDNYLYFTNTEGFFRWNPEEKEEPRLMLPSKKFRINKIYFYNSKIYIGASNGLHEIYVDENDKVRTNHFDEDIGLTDLNIQQILITNKQLFLGTRSGLFDLPMEKLVIEHKDPKIYIRSVKNGSEFVDDQIEGCFSYNQNSLRISTDLLVFKGRSDVEIFYRLTEDQKWTKTDKTEFEFSFLQQGAYTFQVKAKLGTHWSEIQEYKFAITPAFWQRTSVQYLFVFLLIGLIVLFFVLRSRKFHKEKEAEDKILALEVRADNLRQQALKAQINPHFMSNALSSIQSFIRSNQVEKSEQYLNDFGHLMRLVLESSTEQNLEIEKEIKLLTSYAKLEQLRAGFSFDFQVKCDESLLDEGIRIPSMILQPLLENAILHGVSGTEKGKIVLSFVDHGKTVFCSIEDNGEGYLLHAKHKKKRAYKSRAMTIVKDRLNLLNTNERENIVLTDLSTEGSNGTRVDLILPVFY